MTADDIATAYVLCAQGKPFPPGVILYDHAVAITNARRAGAFLWKVTDECLNQRLSDLGLPLRMPPTDLESL